MSTTTPGQALLALLESDLATVGGTPLITLLTSLQKDAGTPLLQEGAILQFVAAAPSAGITLEIEVEQQLLQLVITKVQTYLAAKAAAPGATAS